MTGLTTNSGNKIVVFWYWPSYLWWRRLWQPVRESSQSVSQPQLFVFLLTSSPVCPHTTDQQSYCSHLSPGNSDYTYDSSVIQIGKLEKKCGALWVIKLGKIVGFLVFFGRNPFFMCAAPQIHQSTPFDTINRYKGTTCFIIKIQQCLFWSFSSSSSLQSPALFYTPSFSQAIFASSLVSFSL